MTQIDTTSTINAVRLVEQGSNPASPAASHWLMFIKSDGLYIKDSAGNVTGPFGAGGSVATDAIWDAKGDLAVGTGANTASKLAVGTDGKVLTAASGEATGLKWDTVSASGGRTLISEQTPTGNAATWTSIPGTYWALRIEGVCRMDSSAADGYMYLFCNNDTTATNYRTEFQIVYAGGSTTQNGLDSSQFSWTTANTTEAGGACTFWIDIINYAGTTWKKTAICRSVTRTTPGNAAIDCVSSVIWLSTNAITRIDITAPVGQNWVSGTVMRLYGLS